jgi:large subunit ribosomal protein L19
MDKIITEIEKRNLRKDLPEIKAGDSVRVTFKIKEGDKERAQSFEGVIIRVVHGGLRQSFTVRKISHGVGVERTFFFNSPIITHLEIISRAKVRRAKLYYLRQRKGKKARLKKI